VPPTKISENPVVRKEVSFLSSLRIRPEYSESLDLCTFAEDQTNIRQDRRENFRSRRCAIDFLLIFLLLIRPVVQALSSAAACCSMYMWVKVAPRSTCDYIAIIIKRTFLFFSCARQFLFSLERGRLMYDSRDDKSFTRACNYRPARRYRLFFPRRYLAEHRAKKVNNRESRHLCT